jgi:RimJ/RimL family protein N-acetyltransferase
MSFSIQFDCTKEYILEDNRVMLRPLILTDIAYLTPYVQNEPSIWAFSLMSICTKEDLEQYIKMALLAREEKKEYPFIVFDKQTQTYVGCTRFYDIQINAQSAQLGYTWYSQKVWGTGLNQHCKFLLLQFAFEQMQWARVEFRADNNNKRSIAAMQKIGCKVEGILRSHLPKPDGTRRDSIVLSILKSEWEATVKTNLQNQL